jgi:hypothetical protein
MISDSTEIIRVRAIVFNVAFNCTLITAKVDINSILYTKTFKWLLVFEAHFSHKKWFWLNELIFNTWRDKHQIWHEGFRMASIFITFIWYFQVFFATFQFPLK